MSRRFLLLFGLASAPALLLSASPARGQAVAEAGDVMAAFVARFPQFVEWPTEALDGRSTVDICVWEPNPFGDALREITRPEALDGRPLAVRELAWTEPMDGCHVLFVPAAEDRREEVLRRVEEVPVLTVGASPDFLDAGGMINLRVVGRRVRFEVNAEAVERAGLRVSSQLLGLALDVRRRSL